VDPAKMRLGAASPAIDKGTVVAAAAHDFDGAARPAGAAFDIGAFEYGAPAPDGGAGGSVAGSGGAGPTAGSGGATGSGGAAGVTGGAGGSNAAAPASEASGCGCGIGRRSTSGAIWVAVWFLLLGARRRRS
jgi:MYXO-CTERM domain-containing protein